MKRGPVEWLLIPLFLLPLLAGAGFLVYARSAYFREIRAYREEPERRAREWLRARPERGEWLVRRFAEAVAAGPEGTPFVLEGVTGEIGFRSPEVGDDAWTFSSEWPAGLLPEALAAEKVRLAVETGTAPLRAGVTDPATVAFGALLDAPDLEALRVAPLPASSKAYLLRRWRYRYPSEAWFRPAESMVSAVLPLERAGPPPAAPGVHLVRGVPVVVTDGTPAFRLLAGPPLGALTQRFHPTIDENAGRTVELTYLPYGGPPIEPWPRFASPAVRLESPLAGEYTFFFPHEDRWWEGPVFLRWGGAVAGLCLLFLLLPSALFVSLRRRRRLDQARARFINELAHDLRTPLTSLRLYAEMLAAGKAPEVDRARYVDTMARESGRLSALLANLLDLSRLERGGREFATETIDLDDAVGAAQSDFAALHPTRADDLRVSGPDDATACADPTALARILGNLLDNAGKFTPEATPIRIGWERAEADVRITVADDGPGIAAEDRGRIFRRYERGAGAKRDGVPGTGLGLALVRELAEGMGGRVRLVPGAKGTAFEVTLPGGGDE